MMAMYMYDAFIDSIGIDESEREEGRENRGNGNWKDKILDDTKDRCRAMFASFGRMMDRERDKKRDTRERDKGRLLKNLFPKGFVKY